jgi:hypothetical protein
MNSTISGNQTTSIGAGIEVFATSYATFRLYNTIVANNGEQECFWDAQYPNTVSALGSHNMIGSSVNCPGILSNADPQLGPLQNSQGFTPTMAIPKASPAVLAGDPYTSLPIDQRGQTRPAPNMGGVPDIGSFELCLTGPRLAQTPCIITAGNSSGTTTAVTIGEK